MRPSNFHMRLAHAPLQHSTGTRRTSPARPTSLPAGTNGPFQDTTNFREWIVQQKHGKTHTSYILFVKFTLPCQKISWFKTMTSRNTGLSENSKTISLVIHECCKKQQKLYMNFLNYLFPRDWTTMFKVKVSKTAFITATSYFRPKVQVPCFSFSLHNKQKMFNTDRKMIIIGIWSWIPVTNMAAFTWRKSWKSQTVGLSTCRMKYRSLPPQKYFHYSNITLTK
jgi:hypothetical protein